LATIGSRHNYVTLVNPPRIFSMEWVQLEEIERFRGEHVDSPQIAEAFGLSSPLESPTTQGAAAPNNISPTTRNIAKVAVLFALLNLLLAIAAAVSWMEVAQVSLTGSRTGPTASLLRANESPAYRAALQRRALEEDGGVLESTGSEGLSEPFDVPKRSRMLAVELKTKVLNDWTYITAEMLSTDGEQVLGTTGREVSYYSGVEGNGAWSEGNRNGRILVKAPPPGRYRLQISQESGGASGIVEGRVRLGARLSRYHIWLAILFLLLALAVFALWKRCEDERFGVSYEDLEMDFYSDDEGDEPDVFL
jgi:hypothetical protein